MVDTYSFGEWLKQRREQLRLTQRELASTSHCSVAMIKKIEADERRPSPELARLLALALKLPDSDQERFVEVACGDRPVDFLPQSQPQVTFSPTSPIHAPVSLPNSTTPFIGRAGELIEIAERLAEPNCRLLTLVGPGGVGKTRLALAAAQSQETAFVDGWAFVSLAAITTTTLIPDAIAGSLRLALAGTPAERVLAYLHRREMLLVLDNCEQLEGDLTWLSELLANAPGIKVLATSRERLHLAEEWIYGVPGMVEAEALFVATAQRVKHDFDTEGEKTALAQICQLVGNLPLAVELGAAWVRIIPCAEIAREIEHGLDILATKLHNVSDKHRSMRAAFEHSWRLLSPDEKAVFSKLSVFRGGFTREAAEQVADATLPTLAALMDKSLLRADANGRYDAHELLRQYAREKLIESGEASAGCDLHRDYFLTLAERGGRELFGPNQMDWLNRVEEEVGNFRAAIAWSNESGDIAAGVRLIVSLHHFWPLRGHQDEAHAYLISILSLPELQVPTTLRAMTLYGAADMHLYAGNNAAAIPLLEQASAVAREVGNMELLILADRSLGYGLSCLGEYEAAESPFEESLLLARQLQDNYGVAWSLIFMGDMMLGQGNAEQAQKLYLEGIELLKPLDDKVMISFALRRLGLVMRGYQDYERSKAFYRESLKISWLVRIPANVVADLVGLAGTALAQGHAVHATQFLGAANKFHINGGQTLLFLDQHEYERHLENAHAQLDASVFEKAWADGQSMTMEQAFKFALS
jgi:predicted ATPase/transcriptional regulator with XRE-family HTH domain